MGNDQAAFSKPVSATFARRTQYLIFFRADDVGERLTLLDTLWKTSR
jgi:hypothetical protein